MLRLNVVLLAFLVSSLMMTGEAGRQRRATSSKKERKNVAKLGPEGKNCLAGGKLVCHKDIKTKFSSTLAVICNNGKLEKMKTPFGFKSPRGLLPQCEYKGKKYCEGNDVTHYREWFLEHKCERGTVIYRNLITGLEMVSDQILLKKSRTASRKAETANDI